MEETFNKSGILKFIQRYWIISIIITIVAGALVTFANEKFIPKKYESLSKVLVNRRAQNSANDQYAAQLADIQIVTTYEDIIKSSDILNKVATDVYKLEGDALERKASEIGDRIIIRKTANSMVFSIVAKYESPQESARVANSVAKVFKKILEI